MKIPPRSMFLVLVNTFSQKKNFFTTINMQVLANHAIHHYKFITKNIKTFNNNTFGQYRITSSCYK